MKPPRRQSVAAVAPPQGRASFWKPALVVLGVALLVRLAHVWQIRRAPFFSMLMGDARGYDTWALQIAGGDWIGRDVFYQAPLYPYFLGVIYSIAGHNLLIVRVLQALVGSASCVLVGAAGARLFSPAVGLAAGLTLALYAPAIFFDGLLQKSVLDVFFVAFALWLMSRIIAPGDPARTGAGSKNWLLLGLVMGGLSLTRENAMVFVAVLVAWALTTASRSKAAPAFVAGLAIVLLPVALRNYAVGGGFYVTTSQFGSNFFIGNNPRSDGTYMSLRYGRGAPEYERQDATELAEHALGRTLTPAEVSGYWTDRAMAFITSQPGEWAELLARKFALLWNADEMLDTESQESYEEWSVPLRALSWVGHFGVLVPLAVLGVWATWPERRKLWVFYVMIAAYSASVIMFYVFARYRFPLVPFLILFASTGLARAARVSVPVLIAVLLVAVFANWPLLSKATMQAITENNLATAFQEDGRLDDAVAHYKRAIDFRPDYAPAYNNMGVALRAKGDLDAAVASYERALEAQAEYPDAHYNLANALLEKNKPEEAATHFRTALASIPGSAGTLNNLGIALASQGKLEEAVEQFRAALAADPRSARASRNLGNALSALGKRDEGLAHLRRAVEFDPSDADAHYDLGSDLLERSDLTGAAAEFEAALKLSPESFEAHNNLGIALASQGRVDEAIRHFQEALRIEPGFADALRNLEIARAQKPR
jgi:tetratricopeptide (TPR) repeat protein